MSPSHIKSLRKKATELIRLSDKVFHYRRDLMGTSDLDALRKGALELEEAYRDKRCTGERLENALHSQHETLSRVGGEIYPVRFLNDNVETLLVVAIVILSFRLFFFQPFVIPTNSMYPSYYGMESGIHTPEGSAPSLPWRAFHKITRGASYRSLESAHEGRVSLPVVAHSSRGIMLEWAHVSGRKWFGLLPATFREYSVYVGDRPHRIRVPQEFNLDQVVLKSFFPGADSLSEAYQERIHRPGALTNLGGRYLLATDRSVKQGDAILRFDVLMGDALFVNRMKYHFVKPKLGDPIVFRTGSFANRSGFPTSIGEDKFYIKRLTGEPGDAVEVRNGTLIVNGEPATGARAFAKNAAREDGFPGYSNVLLVAPGASYTVPEGHYFAMGDNSSNSLDSRYFGPVPEKEVIGAAALIYYPFTTRWGPAR